MSASVDEESSSERVGLAPEEHSIVMVIFFRGKVNGLQLLLNTALRNRELSPPIVMPCFVFTSQQTKAKLLVRNL